ncbi:hypothetical protein C2G38_2211930 [Gigaspora rosea]|uniref:Uncharacterized protein n=1 Tax=Gigaspora rosea TaxID=44941 RepID=A0A397UGX8_9GLOM|nr:hypothetical protein C2G38_2211930 [Gigaspora rosea]
MNNDRNYNESNERHNDENDERYYDENNKEYYNENNEGYYNENNERYYYHNVELENIDIDLELVESEHINAGLEMEESGHIEVESNKYLVRTDSSNFSKISQLSTIPRKKRSEKSGDSPVKPFYEIVLVNNIEYWACRYENCSQIKYKKDGTTSNLC